MTGNSFDRVVGRRKALAAWTQRRLSNIASGAPVGFCRFDPRLSGSNASFRRNQ